MNSLKQPLLFEELADNPIAGAELEQRLLSCALALGARDVPGWTAAEDSLTGNVLPANQSYVRTLRAQIRSGGDPLGAMFCQLRSQAERRKKGATFTPPAIVTAMLEWVGNPSVRRIVDPGLGSARFAIAAGLRFPHAVIVGIEIDPLAAVIARANLAAAGLASRAKVMVGDYRCTQIDKIDGKTLFIGNPRMSGIICSAWRTRGGCRTRRQA